MIPRSHIDLMFQLIVLLFQKSTIRLLNSMEFPKYVQRMLQRYRSMECFHNINHSSFGSTDPVCELHIVRYSSTEHNNPNMLRKHNNGFLPNDTSLLIIYIMDLVKYNPLNVSYHLGSSIKIVSQNLSCHDYTRSLLIHWNVSSYYTYWLKFLT